MKQNLRKAKEHPLISKRLYSKKRLFRTLKISIWLSLPVLLVCALSWISFLDILQIRSVVVTGTKTISADIIKSRTEDVMGRPYLYLFSRGTFLTYPKKEIKNIIGQYGLLVKKIEISLSGLKELSINITERTQEALWCSDGQCLLIDDDGLAFDYGSSSAALVFESLDADVFPEIGSYVATSSDFRSFMDFEKRLEKISLAPNHISLGKEGDIILSVASSSLKLMVAFKQDFNKTYQYLTLLRNDPTFKEYLASPKLEYVDLRFGNKVYYKMKGVAQVATSTLEKSSAR